MGRGIGAGRGPDQVFSALRAGFQGAATHVGLVHIALAGQHIARRLASGNRRQRGRIAFDTAGERDIGDQMRHLVVIGFAFFLNSLFDNRYEPSMPPASRSGPVEPRRQD